MILYAIKHRSAPIYWAFAYDRDRAWQRFFELDVIRRQPLEEAIEAYEAIGYKCVAMNCEEAPLDDAG